MYDIIKRKSTCNKNLQNETSLKFPSEQCCVLSGNARSNRSPAIKVEKWSVVMLKPRERRRQHNFLHLFLRDNDHHFPPPATVISQSSLSSCVSAPPAQTSTEVFLRGTITLLILTDAKLICPHIDDECWRRKGLLDYPGSATMRQRSTVGRRKWSFISL